MSEKKQSTLTYIWNQWGCLLSFLAFLGIAIAAMVPAVQEAREAARRMSCHPDQVAFALNMYHETYGSFPPAYTTDANGKPLHSWRVLLLSFMEQHDLYEKIRLDEP